MPAERALHTALIVRLIRPPSGHQLASAAVGYFICIPFVMLDLPEIRQKHEKPVMLNIMITCDTQRTTSSFG